MAFKYVNGAIKTRDDCIDTPAYYSETIFDRLFPCWDPTSIPQSEHRDKKGLAASDPRLMDSTSELTMRPSFALKTSCLSTPLFYFSAYSRLALA